MQIPLSSIINACIPIALGFVFLLYPDQLLPAKDRTDSKKRKLLKQGGLLAILVGIGYLAIAFLKQT